jgi:hypothetical protein
MSLQTEFGVVSYQFRKTIGFAPPIVNELKEQAIKLSFGPQ